MKKKSPGNIRVLTGITTSGTPHLGNYAGAIRPAIQSSTTEGVDAFFFLADYHALIKCEDAERIARSRLEIAATWIAAGLDTERVTFYRQSDIPEIPELCWILSCVTAKGLMNRAHAYKAAVDANADRGLEADDGISMGLFSYPVLMAADILMFNAHRVPVGRDQIQHLEMARDIAQKFNYQYAPDEALFVLPEVQIDQDVATLPGLDGRKMSKSYDNTIPLFEGGSRALRAAISRIVTDSSLPGEPKNAEGSHLYTLYRAFAGHEQSAAFRADLQQGMGWGDAKQQLFGLIESIIGPMREQYASLMSRPERIEEILQEGAKKARRTSRPFIEKIRECVGLRQTAAQRNTVSQSAPQSRELGKKSRLVSFRDGSGRFRQRLLAADGTELLLSEPFDDPKALGVLARSFAGMDLSRLPVSTGGRVNLLSGDGRLWASCEADQVQAIQKALSQL